MELRRKKKKVLKERKSLQEKMRLKMVIPGDTGPGLLENSLFGLTQIKTAEVLITLHIRKKSVKFLKFIQF